MCKRMIVAVYNQHRCLKWLQVIAVCKTKWSYLVWAFTKNRHYVIKL